MRILEMTEQQQIINVWSCTSTICKFIFYSSDLSGNFLVAEKIRGTENFCSSFELAKQQVIISKVDMFEFDTIMSFIVLLIPLLPTPIFFIPFFLYTFLVKTCKKTEKKTLVNSTNWNFVLEQGSIPNMVTGIRVSG